MNNTSLTSNPLRTFVKESIFLSTYSYSSSMDLLWFSFMSGYSTTDYMVPYDLYRTPDSISDP